MSSVLYVSTIVLCVAGVIYSLVYIWLNAFSKITDTSSRNASIIKIVKTSVFLSIVFALLSCLIASPEFVNETIKKTSQLYAIIAVSWLVVILGCGITMLIVFTSKKSFKSDLSKSIKSIFSVALAGAIIGMILSWLLS